MTLPETFRQLTAGAAAALAFLGVYFGLSLNVWAALIAGALVMAAMLLVIRRAPPAAERMVAEGVSAADLDTALGALAAASRRLRVLEARAPGPDAPIFVDMARLLERIRAHHAEDPRDLRHTRGFLRRDLPRPGGGVRDVCRTRWKVERRVPTRLAQLSERIHGFKPVLEKIETACLENDFMKLEVETEVLSDQLKYR